MTRDVRNEVGEELYRSDKATVNRRHKAVLIVEENGFERARLRKFLESNGYLIDESDAIEGTVEKALVFSPDLIVIDLSGPESIETIHRIRKLPALASIPLIAVSDDGLHGINLFTNIDDIGDALIAYITKPINIMELSHQLNEILGSIKE